MRDFPKVILFLLLFFSVVCPHFWAEQDTTDMADYYYEQGFYDQAITEYLRDLFLHPDLADKAELYQKMARCFAEMEEWRKAEQNIRSAIEFSTQPEKKREYGFTLAEILIAAKYYGSAIGILQGLREQNGETKEKLHALFLQAVAYIYLYDWQNAAKCLKEYFRESETFAPRTEEKIMKLLARAQKLPYKSKELAYFLSMIIPGAGQTYAGDPVQGLNALLINGAAGTFTVYTAIDGYYLDAGLLFLYVFMRYYSGNLYHAQRLTVQYNRMLNKHMAQELLDLLTGKKE
ncbi:MAG: hypothetical protein P8107_02225 [Spirochaetia bacterium]